MKKIALILAVLFAFGVAGCEEPKNKKSDDGDKPKGGGFWKKFRKMFSDLWNWLKRISPLIIGVIGFIGFILMVSSVHVQGMSLDNQLNLNIWTKLIGFAVFCLTAIFFTYTKQRKSDLIMLSAAQKFYEQKKVN